MWQGLGHTCLRSGHVESDVAALGPCRAASDRILAKSLLGDRNIHTRNQQHRLQANAQWYELTMSNPINTDNTSSFDAFSISIKSAAVLPLKAVSVNVLSTSYLTLYWKAHCQDYLNIEVNTPSFWTLSSVQKIGMYYCKLMVI